MAAFNLKISELKLPGNFLIIDGDMELLIDTKNALSVRLFLSQLKKKGKLQLKEFLLNDFDSIVRNGDNAGEQFNNEFFLPFKNSIISNKNIYIVPKDSHNVTRTHFPGSEWLSVKIYLGSNTADKLLVYLTKSLQKLIKEKHVEKYFFIKYGDPDYHIRLRLLLADRTKLQIALNTLQATFDKFSRDKLIKNIVIDTYKRELERYGDEKVIHFENIFHRDSHLVLNILKYLQDTGRQDSKWLYALKIVDVYLNSFNLSYDSKVSFAESSRAAFAQEFSADQQTNKFINEKYAFYKTDINNIENLFTESTLNKSLQTFKSKLAIETRFLIDDKSKISGYLSSLIHMHVIRLMGAGNNRLYEFIIYDFYLKKLKADFYKNKS
ncbi:thiopeptide-type bacteriocin biosynthesis protein [Flavobacterium sp. 3HN19-14]|uniref:thiopeptide-type bacteriocin biosynthesis protein n=1 Tax=Flavobacterium sp. 3HN19-14 TaxID=3448133 RepID=UPI003EE2BDA0